MKKYLFILSLSLFIGVAASAQNDQPGKIQERMREYIQNRLGLSKAEAERFTPVFLRYLKDFNQTHRQNQKDPLVMKQKIIELRLHYRGEFRQIMEEQRANKVYKYEDEFRQEARRIILENKLENRRRPNRVP